MRRPLTFVTLTPADALDAPRSMYGGNIGPCRAGPSSISSPVAGNLDRSARREPFENIIRQTWPDVTP
jgi:hypothetical protein